MENLLAIFSKIQQVSPLSLFDAEAIIVQNAGMQHWLNTSLAQSNKITMNIGYALPAQFLWRLVRTVASEEVVPEQSPYSREVLTWRIYQLLASELVLSDSDFTVANRYWQSETKENQQQLKRYQLAQKLADLFEQYLVYRPEWIASWCHGQYQVDEELLDVEDALWQGKLWQLLHQQQPYNPVELIEHAIANLADNAHLLPKRISLFAINAMAPIWLNLLDKISEVTEVHFYHLNPCADYWGDIQTEKQAFQSIQTWLTQQDDQLNEAINPLLANLGQQGREFLNLLQQVSTIDISAFTSNEEISPINSPKTVLSALQQDILTLADARTTSEALFDNSVMITSAHSALREVQGLHDWLLHQFNQDSSLTPKDVLVMCPQIEDYAPYVSAVFTQGWHDLDSKVPPLPCSIADRSSKDSDPIVASFIELLQLPDSRFHVSHIIGLLRVPAVMEKYQLVQENIEKISQWLEAASIHWGLNAEHKNHIVGGEHQSQSYSWQQGLERLMRGFAFGDTTSVINNQLMLPQVEGQDGVILGKLMLFIEHLQHHRAQLSKPRNISDWQKLLTELVENTFDLSAEYSIQAIVTAISKLGEYCFEANLNEAISLSVVKDFLTSHFSEPDTSRQFMIGQVTFCSMIPMRSIPFKVIAILGLNDGQFPRQRQPLSFDLMAKTPAKLGDRSRRGDDRYLFLEAIISARRNLYLSYQGRSIKNNTEKQPSLVLAELMDYLAHGYGWQINEEQEGHIRQMALQPFSQTNYQGSWPSFDSKWLDLVKDSQLHHAQSTSGKSAQLPEAISVAELLRFFKHPSRYFANQQLNIVFEQHSAALADDEPFVADWLASYQLREELVGLYLDKQNTGNTVEQAIEIAQLSGRYADTPITRQALESWAQDSETFASSIEQRFAEPPEQLPFNVVVAVSEDKEISIQTNILVSGEHAIFYRSTTAKFADKLSLYLQQLLLQIAKQQYAVTTDNIALPEKVTGAYFNTKSQKVEFLSVKPIDEPEQKLHALLQCFQAGLLAPQLVNCSLVDHVLGDNLVKGKEYTQSQFWQYWSSGYNVTPFGQDPYIQYFWPQCPEIEALINPITQLFEPVYQAIYKDK